MKTIKIALLLTLIFKLSLSAQDDISKSDWRSKEIRIDGSHKDWNIPFKYYDKTIEMTFDISNNSTHLFLFFMTNDPMKMNKIISAGWQIQLSTKEKSKKFSSVINIPGVQFESEVSQIDPNRKRTINDFIIMVNKYKLQLPGIKAKGFKTKNGDLPVIDKNGISIGIGADSVRNLCYEISIPLNELITDKLLKLTEILQLNVRINAMEVPGEENRDQGISNNRPYTGMEGYVHYPSYMYGNPGMEEVNDFFKANNYKLKFRLAGN
jgi:hypothetical protein